MSRNAEFEYQSVNTAAHRPNWFGFEVFVFLEVHIFANYIVLLPSTLQKYIINPALLKLHLEKIIENLGTGGRVNVYGA